MLDSEDLSALRRQRVLSGAFSFFTHGFVIVACRFFWRYRFDESVYEARRRLWPELDAHEGPIIWAANHLTLIDSFLVFWAVFPLRRIFRVRWVPWSTPEHKNYYHLGGPVKSGLIRLLMYLCRCIPFKREGEDEASVRWREKAYEKCVQVLKDDGAVFVYPEAGRSRSGWFDKHRPKDFLGRMALEAPNAKFLCVYLRGDRQLVTQPIPEPGEVFRMEATVVPAVLPGETTARQVSQRLFDTLAALQEDWFKKGPVRKNCGGNDVVDLKSPLLEENIDRVTGEADMAWIDKHLTPKEKEAWAAVEAGERFRTFWKLFSAKEACHKALAQSGIVMPVGGFHMIEIDLFRRKAMHKPTGAQLDIKFTDDSDDVLHCLAVLRGGWIGDDADPGDFLWQVEEVPAGVSPSEFARERCLAFIAESNDEIGSPSKLAFADDDGLPAVLRGGKPQDWGVSLSHSGRYVAYSFMIS